MKSFRKNWNDNATLQKSTSSGGTQTSPPRQSQQATLDQGTQGQPETKGNNPPQDQGKGSEGKKGKKKSSNPPESTSSHPGTSSSSDTAHRTDFTSRNLGRGRPYNAQHVANTVTGAEPAHTTTTAPTAMALHMQHTYAGLPNQVL